MAIFLCFLMAMVLVQPVALISSAHLETPLKGWLPSSTHPPVALAPSPSSVDPASRGAPVSTMDPASASNQPTPNSGYFPRPPPPPPRRVQPTASPAPTS